METGSGAGSLAAPPTDQMTRLDQNFAQIHADVHDIHDELNQTKRELAISGFTQNRLETELDISRKKADLMTALYEAQRNDLRDDRLQRQQLLAKNLAREGEPALNDRELLLAHTCSQLETTNQMLTATVERLQNELETNLRHTAYLKIRSAQRDLASRGSLSPPLIIEQEARQQSALVTLRAAELSRVHLRPGAERLTGTFRNGDEPDNTEVLRGRARAENFQEQAAPILEKAEVGIESTEVSTALVSTILQHNSRSELKEGAGQMSDVQGLQKHTPKTEESLQNRQQEEDVKDKLLAESRKEVEDLKRELAKAQAELMDANRVLTLVTSQERACWEEKSNAELSNVLEISNAAQRSPQMLCNAANSNEKTAEEVHEALRAENEALRNEVLSCQQQLQNQREMLEPVQLHPFKEFIKSLEEQEIEIMEMVANYTGKETQKSDYSSRMLRRLGQWCIKTATDSENRLAELLVKVNKSLGEKSDLAQKKQGKLLKCREKVELYVVKVKAIISNLRLIAEIHGSV